MKFLKPICKSLGKHNNPVYTVVAIAVFKGIFRPLFTMMDKKQEKESKKYAAVREGSTELIAIPTYIGLSKLVKKLAPAFAVDKNIARTLESSRRTLGFFGVCFAALVVIPGLCNAAMPHVMKAFKNTQKQKDHNSPQITAPELANPFPAFMANQGICNSCPITRINTGGGMRI